MAFNKGMVDKPLQVQLQEVFTKCDKQGRGSLTLPQFNDFLFAVGMDFIKTDYSDNVKEQLFKGNTTTNRVAFDDFFQYLESSSSHNFTPEQFQVDMNIFDEDHNGQAVIEDVVRVLKTYAGLKNDAEISNFVKLCIFGPDLTDE